MLDIRLKLRQTLSLRTDESGRFLLWVPKLGRHVHVSAGELEVLGLMAPGSTPRQAFEAGDFAEEAQFSAVVEKMVDLGILEVDRASATPTSGPPLAMDERAPIFILGCPRSGTTLLRWIVDTHSRIHCPAETRFLVPLRELYRRHLLQGAARRVGLTQVEILASLRQFYAGLMEGLAGRAGKPRWADKTPHYSLIPEFIYELFEGQCRFVIPIRHALDVADSFATARGESWAATFDELAVGDDNLDMPMVSGARIWARFNEHLRRFNQSHPEVCTVIRYESLVQDPERTCTALFESVGEKLEPGLLDRVFQSDHGTGPEDGNIRTKKSIDPSGAGRWRSFPRQVIESVADIVNPELEAWGFERVL